MPHYTRQPKFCRPEAYFAFHEALGELHATRGLLRAAVAVSMHALDDATCETVEDRLDTWADRICRGVNSRCSDALLAHVHEFLFEHYGLLGNRRDYGNPLNSYIPAVLDSRRGLPITLTLIYKVVGESVGLTIEGVNAPGHFMARVAEDRTTQQGSAGHSQQTIVDPFNGGTILTEAEAIRRAEQASGRPIPSGFEPLPTASHRDWLARIIRNLYHRFSSGGYPDDTAAMRELMELLAAKA